MILFLPFLVPLVRLGIKRRRKLRVARDAIQPFIRESNQKFGQSWDSALGTKLDVLIENHKDHRLNELVAEHGLSVHVERNGKRFLFDTGLSGALVQNASAMNIELQRVDAVVISHGHRDHGGGLKAFFGVNDRAHVYLGKGAVVDRFSPLLWFHKARIGLDATVIEANRKRIHFVESTTELTEGISIITKLRGPHPAPLDSGTLLKRKDSRLAADDFVDEIALVVEDPGGLVVLSGCGHNGVLNLVQAVKREFPNVPVKLVLGGFHLMNPRSLEMSGSRDEIERLGQDMLDSGAQYFMTGHCTGVDAFMVLKSVMKDKLDYISTGSRIKF